MTIDTTFLDSDADQVQQSRPALLAIANFCNSLGALVGAKLDFTQLLPPATGGTDTRGVELTFNAAKGAARYGGSDATPQDDQRNHWRGLPSVNSWGSAANIGLYSTAWNRNGAAFAAYSNAFGHDCVTYGVASTAGGAGCATGNPDSPADGSGYCAFSWGKNNLAMGTKSFAMGEEGKANSRASGVFGYSNITGAGLTSHPNSQAVNGIVSDGIGAMALGYLCEAYGDGAAAIGKNIKSYNGAQTFGSGINDGNPMINEFPNSAGFGSKVIRPTFTTLPGDGTVGDKGKTASRSPYYCLVDVNTVKDVVGLSLGGVVTNTGGGGYVKPVISGIRAGTLTPLLEVDPVTLVPRFFGDQVQLGTQKTPATATSAGEQGAICWDAAYIYICISTNTWKRVAITGGW